MRSVLRYSHAPLLAAGCLLALGLPAATPPPAPAHHPVVRLASTARSIGIQPTAAGRVAALDAATHQTAGRPPTETTAYGVPDLWQRGITGLGTTVAVVESFGDPNAGAFLDAYSDDHGLPHAQLDVVTPAGPLPDCTPEEDAKIGCTSWIGETDLDIAMVHAMAPAAHIVIAATPVNETEGFAGMPEMMTAIDYLAENHAADVISLSFGTAEEDFPQLSDPTTLDWAFDAARRAGIPVLAASGDCGATDNTVNSASQCDHVFPYRVVSWPASDPAVIAVGGTVLHLDADHRRVAPDTLWPMSGAGLSKTYPRPAWQDTVNPLAGRSSPDITMLGIVGTSQASPLFAGVLALATQVHGGRLGDVTGALYRMGTRGTDVGIVDVTDGDNTQYGVPGFPAGPGFDTASGWGTVDPGVFVPALAHEVYVDGVRRSALGWPATRRDNR